MGAFSYAQCISQDTERGMFKGIAVDFLRMFPVLESLRCMQMEGRLGTAVPVTTSEVFIYNLISKEKYYKKPTLDLLRRCLVSMNEHAVLNNVPGINMPLIGSGLDRLDFRKVFQLICDVFGGSRVHIQIYYLYVTNEIESYIDSGYFVATCSLSQRNAFRTMELDRPISGKAYIGRIKAVDNFGAEDLLYGVVYKGSKEQVDFNLFKSVCSTHNKMFFYAMSVNKDSATFTMRKCLSIVENYPMVGTCGVSMLNFPLTFSEFGKLAYETGVLSSSKGYDLLCQEEKNQNATENEVQQVPLPPPVSTVTRVRSAITKQKEVSDMIKNAHENAKKLKSIKTPVSLTQGERLLLGAHDSLQGNQIFTDNDIPADTEEIIEEVDGTFTNITTDAFKERCLVAEAKVDSFESAMKEKDAQIASLKAEVVAATQSSEKFMTAAALSDAQRREYRSDNASEVVDGLRTEFDTLKGISKHLSSVTKSVDNGNTENVDLLSEVLRHLEDFQQRFNSLDHAVKANTEQIAKIGDTLHVSGLKQKQVTDSCCQTSGFVQVHGDRLGIKSKVFNDYSDAGTNNENDDAESNPLGAGQRVTDRQVRTDVGKDNRTAYGRERGGHQNSGVQHGSGRLGAPGSWNNDSTTPMVVLDNECDGVVEKTLVRKAAVGNWHGTGNAICRKVQDNETSGPNGRYLSGTGDGQVYREVPHKNGLTQPTFSFNSMGGASQHQLKNVFTQPPPPLPTDSQGRICYPPPSLGNNNMKPTNIWLQQPKSMKRNSRHEDDDSTPKSRSRWN